MAVFPSDDWIEQFCVNLRDHPRAGNAARALDGVYRFVIEPSGPLADRYVYDVAIRPDGGEGARVTPSEDGAAPRLTLTATYDRWRQLIRGELDIGLAVMLRRLRVSGDIGQLRSKLNDTRPLVDALHGVETEWLA